MCSVRRNRFARSKSPRLRVSWISRLISCLPFGEVATCAWAGAVGVATAACVEGDDGWRATDGDARDTGAEGAPVGAPGFTCWRRIFSSSARTSLCVFGFVAAGRGAAGAIGRGAGGAALGAGAGGGAGAGRGGAGLGGGAA